MPDKPNATILPSNPKSKTTYDLLLTASLLPSLFPGGRRPLLIPKGYRRNILSSPASKRSVSITESRTDQTKAKCGLGTPEKSGGSTESILQLAFMVPQKVLLDRQEGSSGLLWVTSPQGKLLPSPWYPGFGLFPTDGPSQALGDQSSSQHTVPAMPEVRTKFSFGLCWCRSRV